MSRKCQLSDRGYRCAIRAAILQRTEIKRDQALDLCVYTYLRTVYGTLVTYTGSRQTLRD
jgi:hypothetical protein